MDVKRRKFLNFIIGGSFAAWLGSVLYPIISYLKPPPVPEANVSSIKAGRDEDIEPDSGKILQFGRKPVILIKTKDGQYKAFAATCTHLDCIVQYRKDFGSIWCACHNGHYDLNGNNISGPPPRPLEVFAVNVVNGEVYVSKNKG